MPLADQIIHGLKNRPWIAYLIVFATCVSGLAWFSDAASTLWKFGLSLSQDKDFEHPASEDELRSNLIKLSHDGCYFFRWDSSAIEAVPKDVIFAQEGYFDQLMGGRAAEQVFVYGQVEPNYSRQYAMALSLRATFERRESRGIP